MNFIYEINSIILILYRRNKSTDHKTEFYGTNSDVSVAKWSEEKHEDREQK